MVVTNRISQFWKIKGWVSKVVYSEFLAYFFYLLQPRFFVPTLGWVHRIWYLQPSCKVTSLRFNISRKATESSTRSLSKVAFFAPILISSFLLVSLFQHRTISEKRQFRANMSQSHISMHSLHLGEIFALALGFSFSSLAVAARVYTKMRLTSTMGKEDCEFTPWMLLQLWQCLAKRE